VPHRFCAVIVLFLDLVFVFRKSFLEKIVRIRPGLRGRKSSFPYSVCRRLVRVTCPSSMMVHTGVLHTSA
jgi:hypothetical protein